MYIYKLLYDIIFITFLYKKLTLMNYKVTYAIDSLDPNPTVKIFDEEYEALEWLHDEVQRRVDYVVQHSPYTITDEEYQEIEQNEYSLVSLEEV